MSIQVSQIPSVNLEAQAMRRTPNFHPNIWGDLFANYVSEDKVNSAGYPLQEIEQLKEEVRTELLTVAAGSSQLNLIDEIQRLGLGYHYQKELDDALQNVYQANHDTEDDDLYTVSLRFRLLRQHGYHVSCDAFKNFKDDNGHFKESLTSDAVGLLSLYEAAHLGIHGEDILDEAIIFTTNHLKSLVTHLSNPLKAQVIHALWQTLHRGIPRLENKRYISFYQDKASHNKTLLKLAQIDFNLVQSLHKKELSEITRWWKDLDFARKLPFARDRLVEGYFWIVGVYFEPKYSLARKILTKIIAMTSVIDDIYVYGTPEELELFTEAIERWDASCTDQLPQYMQIFYEALLDLYSEIERELAREGWSYRVQHAIREMKILARGYDDESKWFDNSYIPAMDEYMRVALVTSGYTMLATASFLGMDNIVTKETFDWMLSRPKIITASEIIGRLVNDVKSHKFEQERGHASSAVESYMNQYRVSEEDAGKELYNRVYNAWKDINEECLKPIAVPMPVLLRAFNLARVIDVISKEGDGYTHVGKFIKDEVASLLIDPIPVSRNKI